MSYEQKESQEKLLGDEQIPESLLNQNVVLNSIISQDTQKRGLLLQILKLAPNFNLAEFIPDQETLQKALGSMTPTLVKVLDGVIYESKSTQYLSEVNWPNDLESAVFRHNSLQLEPEQCD